MTRFAVWGQLVFILGCIGYSTYALFKGDFEQALLPYPVLILYYLIFVGKRVTGKNHTKDRDREEETGP
jgi:hypothetical protein